MSLSSWAHWGGLPKLYLSGLLGGIEIISELTDRQDTQLIVSIVFLSLLKEYNVIAIFLYLKA